MPDQLATINRRLTPFWVRPGMFSLSLLTMFLDTYGTDALQWDPATVDMELRDDFAVDVPPANFDRLMTAIGLLTTDGFFKSVPDFVKACVSLSGHHPTQMMVLPDSEDLAWGMTEAMLISPPDDDDEMPFDVEVIGFISEVLKEEGILTPPDVLRVAVQGQNLLDSVSYDYSDDPEMFSAIHQTATGKSDSINALVKGRLHALLTQLEELPLKHGKTAFVKQLLRKLPQASESLPLPS